MYFVVNECETLWLQAAPRNDKQDIPDDPTLEKVATKAKKYDLLLLGNKMDFTTPQLQSLERKFPNDKKQQVRRNYCCNY